MNKSTKASKIFLKLKQDFEKFENTGKISKALKSFFISKRLESFDHNNILSLVYEDNSVIDISCYASPYLRTYNIHLKGTLENNVNTIVLTPSQHQEIIEIT